MCWDVEEVVKIQEYSRPGPPEPSKATLTFGVLLSLGHFRGYLCSPHLPPKQHRDETIRVPETGWGSPLNQGTFAEDCRSGQSPAKNREKRERKAQDTKPHILACPNLLACF